MKSVQSFAIFISVFVGLASSAADNPPTFNEMKNVGRVMVFPTFKKNIWFSPTAFSVSLDCSPSLDESLCSLRVMNRLSESESKGLSDLKKSGQQLLFFSDSDLTVVGEIQGGFNDLDARFKYPPQILNTLMMSPKFPYASAVARLRASDAAALALAFQTVGLGKFETTFEVKGEWAGDYLALDGASSLLKMIRSDFTGAMPLSKLKPKMMAAIAQANLMLNGIEKVEAPELIYRYLLGQYFIKDPTGRYSPNDEAIANAPDTIVMIDDAETGSVMCWTSILLKKDALSKTICTLE